MNLKLNKLLAEISAGELVDKITILEIKKKKIKDQEKLAEVDKELISLNNTFQKNISQNADLKNMIKDLKEIEMDEGINIYVNKQNVGELRSAVFTPNPKHLCVIGIAMIKKGYFDVGQEFTITVDQKNYKGEVCSLPFI